MQTDCLRNSTWNTPLSRNSSPPTLKNIPQLGKVRGLYTLYGQEEGTWSQSQIPFEEGLLYARLDAITPGISQELENRASSSHY